MELGQRVRVRGGRHAGENGTITGVEECSRQSAAEWRPCVLWYVNLPSRKTVHIYEEESLEIVAPRSDRVSSAGA